MLRMITIRTSLRAVEFPFLFAMGTACFPVFFQDRLGFVERFVVDQSQVRKISLPLLAFLGIAILLTNLPRKRIAKVFALAP